MKFRDDIDPANTWVTSDSHFGHENIVGFCHRPEDHEQVMIAEWRKVVPDDATVVHLGDLAYRGNARFKHLIAKELTGAKKKVILGNHDHQRPSFYRDSGFQVCRPFQIGLDIVIHDSHEILIPSHADNCADVIVSFSHYPWSDAEEGFEIPSNHWRLHGHIHNSGYSRDAFVPFLRNHINLSVEQTKYRPVNLKALLDAAIMGTYDETTPQQILEAKRRKEARRT